MLANRGRDGSHVRLSLRGFAYLVRRPPRMLITALPPLPATNAGRETRLLEEDDGRWSAIDEQTGVARVILARKRLKSSTRWWRSTGAEPANLSPRRTRHRHRFSSRRTTGTGRAVVRFRGVGVAWTRFTGRPDGSPPKLRYAHPERVRRNETVPPGHDTLRSIAGPAVRLSARTNAHDVRYRRTRFDPTAIRASVWGSAERS